MLIYQATTIDDVLSPDQCKQIIAEANRSGWEKGRVWKAKDQMHSYVDERYLKSNRAVIEFDWLTDRLTEVFHETNDRIWQFDLDGKVSTRVARYVPGEFFGPHIDLGGELGFNRKLTMSVQLSDPSEYHGGFLALQYVDTDAATAQGSGTMYPTFVPHKVTEVTQGVRYSLITWIDGTRPFR